MSTITTCECGAKVRLPEASETRALRCPVCKAGIALSIDARVLSSTRLGGGQAGATCPLCQSEIRENDMAVTCPKCDQVHHRECWAEVGGCGSYGCEQAPPPLKDKAVAPTPLSAWGDDKRCPACGEKIKAIALKCRYCGTEFDTVDPLRLVDLHRKIHRGERASALQKGVLALFVLSLIGCLAPLTLIASLVVVVPRLEQLRKAGPLYLVLGYSALILSAIYSILMLFFTVLHFTGRS